MRLPQLNFGNRPITIFGQEGSESSASPSIRIDGGPDRDEDNGFQEGRIPNPVSSVFSIGQQNPVAARCIQLIASTLAGLPKYVASGPTNAREGGPISDVLMRPSKSRPGYSVWEDLLTRMCVEGNAFAVIRWRGENRESRIPEELVPVEAQLIEYFTDNRLSYTLRTTDQRLPTGLYPQGTLGLGYGNAGRVENTNASFRTIYRAQEDVLHFRFSGINYEGVPVAPSPIYMALAMLRGWHSSEELRYDLKTGKNPSSYMVFPEVVNPKIIEQSFKQWLTFSKKIKSTMSQLPPGARVDKAGFSNADLQLIEDLKFDVLNICRVYGVPPFAVGHVERNQGRNDQMVGGMFTNLYRLGLKRHIQMIESECNFKFRLSGVERRVVLDVDKLTQGSDQEIARLCKDFTQSGVMSPNELREKFLGLPPKEGGDDLPQPTGAPAKSNTEENEDDD